MFFIVQHSSPFPLLVEEERKKATRHACVDKDADIIA